jgi:Domain of unknown function (DUF4276)
MIRINIIVEGQTEETFVRDVLKEPLAYKQIYLETRAIETSRDKRKIYRGGLLSYGRAKKDIQRWIKQDKNASVTTMFDYYALPEDFPKHTEARKLTDPYQKVELLEQALFDDIASQNFIPYIQLHEFEALLFTDIGAICQICSLSKAIHKELSDIQRAFTSPEHINDNPDTAPSKRLEKVYPAYEKINDGVPIAKTIGLSRLRQACSHFNTWLERLEKLSGM